MSKAIKVNGKFVLEPTASQEARHNHKVDVEKLLSKLTDEELRAILQRILTRLKALE